MKIKKTNLLFIWLFCLGIACRVGAAEDSDDKLERESLRKIQMRKASTTAEAAISEYKRYMREFSSRVNQISSVAILKQDLEGASLEDKNLLLLRYSMLGKLPMVKCLVKSNADVNVNNEDGWSPLTLAARFGRQKIAQYIVQNNADVNREGYRKRTPLMEAAIKDYKVLTHIFVDSKADLSRKDENNITALELAIKLRCFDSAAILLVAQEEFFTKKAKKNKSTRLMCAAREGDYYMVTQYFDEDNIDSIDKRGFTALMKAAQYGHLRVVNFLIDSRADIFKVNEYGTALTLAVQSGYSD
ncbi:MAG: ankyrin repeat domain-containing protein, partial [Candidatus Babeliales bacterium]